MHPPPCEEGAPIILDKTYTMRINIKNAFLVLLGLLLMSCSDNDSSSAASPYEQYGEVFTGMPAKQDAIIYQVNVRSFSPEGTLDGVKQKLGYIKELGANVIYLMPIYPIGEINQAGSAGSPYAVKNYKEVNTNYGTFEDLRALVDEAHSMDMAVILDWVANHTAWDNPWITEHPEWYRQDDNGNIISPPGTNWNDVAQLDYENAEMRAAMIDAMSYWVYNANIDGFRCDAADFIGQGFWSEAIASLRAIKKQELLMLAEGSRFNHFSAGFDYTFGFAFFDALKKVYVDGHPATELQTANSTEYANNYADNRRVVRYTTNHDVNLTDGTPTELFKGKQGSLSAFVIAAYMKSVPMIYNAQEIGYGQRIDFLSNMKIDWSNPDGDMLEQYKKILAFRKSSDAIKRGNYTGYSNNAICAFTMEYNDEKVLVLSNVTNTNANYIVPPALGNTAWKHAFTDAPVTIEDEVALPPFMYFVLKN